MYIVCLFEENFGLDLIEVRDDGAGIKQEDVPLAALPHFTSKISSLGDLDALESYGFRGEALSSLAAVCDLSITTRMVKDAFATCYVLDHTGHIASTRPSHLGVGTTITAAKIFHSLPVRRQRNKQPKMCREELKKVEHLLLAFGLASPRTRFFLRHGKTCVWQKAESGDFKSNLHLVFGPAVLQQMQTFSEQFFDPMLKVFGCMPRPLTLLRPQATASPMLVSRATPERIFVLVNRRPVFNKQLVKVMDG